MAEALRKYMAIITKRGLYQFLQIPYGLKNNPNYFSYRMVEFCGDMVTAGEVMLYMDDIIVYSEDEIDHNRTIRKLLLQRCREKCLKISIKKCTLLKNEVSYLGHLVTDQGVLSNPAKIEIIKTHSTPTTKKQLQSFMGLMKYYRRVIPGVAAICAPLHALLRKVARYIWTDICKSRQDK